MPRFRAHTHDLPLGPPPEVLLQIEGAWERARDLFDTDLELRFEIDGRLRRVWAELRWSDGSVLERLTASEALALACGDTVQELAVAA